MKNQQPSEQLPKNYSNKELATAYFQIAGQYAKALKGVIAVRSSISKCRVGIHEFYRTHEGLDELRIPGVSRKSKLILELIIEKGIDHAKEAIAAKKLDYIRRMKKDAYDAKRREHKIKPVSQKESEPPIELTEVLLQYLNMKQL